MTVADVNETPIVTTGPTTVTYAENGTTDLGTYGATDEEDDGITWSLGGDDSGSFSIGSTSGTLAFKSAPDFENPADTGSNNVYEVTVHAYDGVTTEPYDVTVTVTNINETPVAFGESSFTYDENNTAEVASYSAADQEGDTIQWSLTGTDSGDFRISDQGVVNFAATPDWEEPTDSNEDNVFTFTVTASDGHSSDTIDVTVTVADLEELGVIAGSSSDPVVGQTMTFTLSDPDGLLESGGALLSPITWTAESRQSAPGSWTQISTVLVNDVTYSFTPTEDHTGRQLRVRVEYQDRRGTGKTAQSEVTKAVSPDPITNAPPRFVGSRSRSVAEGEAGRSVGAPIGASDRENDPLTFDLSDSNPPSFEINSSTGQLRTAQALDFETGPPSGNYLLTVTLHDSKDPDGNPSTVVDTTTTVLVTLTDVEEAGVVTLSVEEPEPAIVLSATLDDGDGGVSAVSWQWARSENRRSGWTNITGATLSVYTPGDDDAGNYLRATASYTDRRGPGKSAQAVPENPVASENRRPRFASSEDGRRSISENTREGVNIGAPVAAEDPENDRLTYTISGPDSNAFQIISRTGQLRTKEALDFEVQSVYWFTISVHDGRDGAGNPSTQTDDEIPATVTIQDMEEPGTVTLSTARVAEGLPVRAELNDPDRPIASVIWQWASSPNGRSNWANKAGATSDTYTPSSTDVGRWLRATVSYNDRHGSDKTAHAVTERAVLPPPPINSPAEFPTAEGRPAQHTRGCAGRREHRRPRGRPGP